MCTGGSAWRSGVRGESRAQLGTPLKGAFRQETDASAIRALGSCVKELRLGVLGLAGLLFQCTPKRQDRRFVAL